MLFCDEARSVGGCSKRGLGLETKLPCGIHVPAQEKEECLAISAANLEARTTP